TVAGAAVASGKALTTFPFSSHPRGSRRQHDYSCRGIDRKRGRVPALTKRGWSPLSACDRRSLTRERTGNAVRNHVPRPQLPPHREAGSPGPFATGENPGKAVRGGDPRARRPAVDSVVARAGCLGAGRFAFRMKHPGGAVAPVERHG